MATHPVFLPGKSHGQTSLVGYSPQGHKRVGHNSAAKQQCPALVSDHESTLFQTVTRQSFACLISQNRGLSWRQDQMGILNYQFTNNPVSITTGLHLLAEAQFRLSSQSLHQNCGHYPCYFLKYGNKQNYSIYGRNISLTYKLNLKKTSPFFRNGYKEKKIIFHD